LKKLLEDNASNSGLTYICNTQKIKMELKLNKPILLFDLETTGIDIGKIEL
jgi:hypothetical protein